MYEVNVKDQSGEWEAHAFNTADEAFAFVVGYEDVPQAIEIEGAEFDGAIPTFEEIESWLAKTQKPAITVFLNRDERYGDDYIVTIEDYRQQNPTSEFEYSYQWFRDVITERTDDADNPFIIVAVGYNNSEDDDQFDNELETLTDNQIDRVKAALKEASSK